LEKANEEAETLEGEDGVVKELVGIALSMRFVLSFFRCLFPPLSVHHSAFCMSLDGLEDDVFEAEVNDWA
jgi:hypothetical protein